MSTLANAPIAARPNPQAMIDVAGQREIAEVQAAMIMARRFPRNHVEALDRITMACARPELAEAALYTYARGGTDITGPSIRLAEAIAQNWGNIQFGIRELEQRNGESTVEAFAMDLETNTRQVKVFQVPHVRYTRNGGRTALEDPRDVYEQTANQGARRLRACILGIIPGDVIDAAVTQVELTMKTKANVTPEGIAKMLAAFEKFGVTKAQIEKRIQRRIDALTPALMVQLIKIGNSLKDGMSQAADWFEPDPGTDGGAPAPAPANQVDAVKDRLRSKAPRDGASEAAPVGEAAPASAVSAEPAGGEDEPLFDNESPELSKPQQQIRDAIIHMAGTVKWSKVEEGTVFVPEAIREMFVVDPGKWIDPARLAVRPLPGEVMKRYEEAVIAEKERLKK